MDIRTGRVFELTDEEFEAHEDKEFLKRVPNQKPRKKTGRNALCPCMSGKKFKNCCLWKESLKKDRK